MTALAQFLIRIDKSIFKCINSLAGKSSVGDWLARLGADDHIIPILLVLMVLFMVLIAKDRAGREAAFRCLICALLAAIFSMVILLMLNSLFFRPRPFTGQSINLLFYHNTDSAFPSNAATIAFVLSFSALFYNRRIGLAMLGLSLYLGFSRVMVGVHYPLDILAGLLLGISSAFLAYFIEPLYRPFAGRLAAALDRLLCAWKPGGGWLA